MNILDIEAHLKVRIYYEDTDSGGIVYHSKYLNFAERSRAEFFRKLKLDQIYIKKNYNILFVVKSLKIDYINYSILDDNINIVTKVMEINQAKIIFNHAFYNKKKSIAKILVKVCSIKSSGKVARMPKALYNKIISKG
jgi:acyl-CoA thioester hydrolase